MCTFSITFGPKVITIYKDASGFLAQRVSDSKASASELSRNPGTRTIKELAQQPIRLMDRVTLRVYAALLEKELSAARAALATLDANEGVLAGGGGHAMTQQQHASQVRTISGLGNTAGNGSAGLLARPPAASTPPGSTARLMTTGPGGNQGFTPNNNSPRSRAGSVYKYPGPNGTPNNGNTGGPRASSPNLPI